MKRDFFAGAIQANNIKNRVTVVKNVTFSVHKSNKEFVSCSQGLRSDADISKACGVDANNGTVSRFAIKKAISNHSFAKLAVKAIKTGAVKNLCRIGKQLLLFEGSCAIYVMAFCGVRRAMPSISSGRVTRQSGSAKITTPTMGVSVL